MECQLPIYQNGVPAGTLTRREEGLHSLFQARCKGGEGLRKVWLQSENGGRLLLGTLVPDGDGWSAGCRVVRSNLERQGLTGRLWGEIVAAGEEREPVKEKKQPPVCPKDQVLSELYSRQPAGAWRIREGGWQAAFVWQPGQPVPWLPLICFARPGQGELCFLLDEEGYPAIY